jgi:hypothetical protein
VRFITELRPKTVIKDDAIPTILASASFPTFVTINVTDFWRRIPASPNCCVVCIALEDRRTGDLPALLRRVLALPSLATKDPRMGKVIRVSHTDVVFYGVGGGSTPNSVPLPS